QGEIYNQFGFNDSITGFYTQNLQTTLGCDSIVNLSLNVHSVPSPTNLSLDDISNYIELTWNGDEENYIIYKDSDSLAITNLKVYRDTNVVVGENYCYKIKALTVDCYSDYSSEECMIFSSIGSVNTYNLNVTLYPNPTENKTILRFDGEKENADIHIYDINGKLVKTLKLKAEDDELEINVQGFEKGVYNIRITNSKINIIKKLIII
ncbi:MAG: T9SS type A sorting domain-containing protein, partial [Bacteroidales bacterium]|nr:T9SS type A sorting domain-containing protein [Bacteroidales bacterium]